MHKVALPGGSMWMKIPKFQNYINGVSWCGRYHIIPPIIWEYIPLIYCLLGDYIYIYHLQPVKGTRNNHWWIRDSKIPGLYYTGEFCESTIPLRDMGESQRVCKWGPTWTHHNPYGFFVGNQWIFYQTHPSVRRLSFNLPSEQQTVSTRFAPGILKMLTTRITFHCWGHESKRTVTIFEMIKATRSNSQGSPVDHGPSLCPQQRLSTDFNRQPPLEHPVLSHKSINFNLRYQPKKQKWTQNHPNICFQTNIYKKVLLFGHRRSNFAWVFPNFQILLASRGLLHQWDWRQAPGNPARILAVSLDKPP